jgi:hypothetical protein
VKAAEQSIRIIERTGLRQRVIFGIQKITRYGKPELAIVARVTKRGRKTGAAMKNQRAHKLNASLITSLSLALCLLATQTALASVDIVEVKNVGVSAADHAKSIIQIRWTAQNPQGGTIKSFDLTLEVAYADGARERLKATVNGAERNARFEVPTVHITAGRPAAELKQFTATIIANATETTTKQGNL